MLNDDEIAKPIIEQKLILMTEILKDLSNRFPNFHFNLSACFLSDPGHKEIVNYNVMNEGVPMATVQGFIDPLESFLKDCLKQKNLIDEGKIVVACLNDREQSASFVNTIEQYRCYVVKHIHVVGVFRYFILDGMDNGETPGYESQRFVILFNNYSRN